MSTNNMLSVRIRNAEEIIFEGDAELITSTNEAGRFDVLPLHANFISIAQDTLIVFKQKQKIKELKIGQAVIKVTDNKVHVFLGLEALDLLDEVENHKE